MQVNAKNGLNAISEIPIVEDLKRCGVTRFIRENNTLQLIFDNQKAVIFESHLNGILKTIENLRAAAKDEKIDRDTMSKIVIILSDENNGYIDILRCGNGCGSQDVNNNSSSNDDDRSDNEEDINDTDKIGSQNSPTAGTNPNAIEEPEQISVSQALRRKKGYVRVKGQVIGYSSIYNMIVRTKLRCDSCKNENTINHGEKPLFRSLVKELSKCPVKSCAEKGFTLKADFEYITTIDLELQDPEKFSEIEKIKVRLFEDNTKDIFAGKIVTTTGSLHVVRENDNPKNKPTTVLYAEVIDDAKKQDTDLTQKDIEEILSWKKSLDSGKDLVDVIAAYFAPQIIGYDHVKKGLLMVAANAGIPNEEKRIPKRLRLNALLIGDPSLAKSTFLYKLVEIIPNARYESCQSSTGLSLTAQVSKEEGGIYTLRHGPIPLASGSICALNEIGQMHISEHKHFLDCMQEGHFTLNKYGFNAPIVTNTSIVASANPINNTWKDPERIEQSEFPTLTQIVQRFDFIFIFTENTDPVYLREYTTKREEIARQSALGVFDEHDNFLRKYLMYARTFQPVISDEARTMLNDYWINMGLAGVRGLPRKLESLESAAIALAKLKLKNLVEAEDITEIMEFYNILLVYLRQSATLARNPRNIAYEECIDVLKSSKFPITYEEVVKSACKRNEQVKRYIGDKYTLEHNKKLRPILDLLVNNSHIIQTSQRPIALQWTNSERHTSSNSLLSDHSDHSDLVVDGIDECGRDGLADDNNNNNNNKKDIPDAQKENKSPSKGELINKAAENTAESKIELAVSRSDRSDRSDRNPTLSMGTSNQDIEEFFYDNSNTPWKPLPDHTLEQSPCCVIIGTKVSNNVKIYYCKVHQNIQNIHLETIEHHCKYYEAEVHKKEIISRLLKSDSSVAAAS